MGSRGDAIEQGTPKKKMSRATKRLPCCPHGEWANLNAEMMELLLDISTHLHAMKAYIARHEEAEKAQETNAASSHTRSLLTDRAGREVLS